MTTITAPTVLFDVKHDPEGSPALPSEGDRLEQAFAQFEREYGYPLMREGSLIGRKVLSGKNNIPWRQMLSQMQRQRVIEMLARYSIAALHGASDVVVVIWHDKVEQMAQALSLTDLRALEAAFENAQCECERAPMRPILVHAGLRQYAAYEFGPYDEDDDDDD